MFRHRLPRPCRVRRPATLAVLLLAGAMAAGCSSDDDDSEMPTGNPDGMEPGAEGSMAIGIPSDDADGFSEGVVTAANPLAAAAGIQALQNGGNAIDAAVAVQFVLNVVEPTSSGIGGGGFMGVHLAEEGRTFYIDSREKAPAATTPTQFLACDPDCGSIEEPDLIGPEFTDVATSGIAVGVPGTLLGAAYAVEQYGNLTLADAIAPAIPLARDGFEINERLFSQIDNPRTTFWPELRELFRDENGDPRPVGYLLVQPDLANTLQLISDQGPSVFYEGAMAEAIVSAQLNTRDTAPMGAGRMTTDDLASYLASGVDERDPIVSDYRGYTINGMPPPSSGGLTVAQILECMEPFDMGNEEAGFGFGSTQALNVMIESMRLAFSSRSVWMGDTDFVDLPIEGLLADDYLAPRCAQITADARIADEEVVPGDPRAFDPAFAVEAPMAIGEAPAGESGVDTTHFTVIDANGNVVTWTSTIEGTWGTGIIVPGYGFILNNEMTDFNFFPQANTEPMDEADFMPGANDAAPGKRPRSSMAPTLVFEGDTFLAAYGSPGGPTIINSVVNITSDLIDHGLAVQEAIDLPRVSTSGEAVSFEAGFDDTVVQALRDLGHELDEEPSDEIGSVQAVVVDPTTGLQYGGADLRRAGTVQGLPASQ